MSKKVTLITGGNGDLGIAVARNFLDTSADSIVFLGVRENRGQADALASEFPDRVGVESLDVTCPESWERTVEAILERHGRLDVLVNNAGFHRDALLGTMSPGDWDAVLRTNLDGVFYGCQAVVKAMMGQRFGRIVNISSLSALMAPRGQTNYAAAKAGVIALTQSFAKEVARSGITVNAVCPGYVDTSALGSLSEDERRERMKAIPMRRFGRPGEVAAAVGFLASAEASYVTGATLKIDGGIL